VAKKPARPTRTAHVSTIPAGEFKATCLELMDTVARTRTDIIVTKHGRPVVRVCPVEPEGTSPVGFLAGSIVSHGDIVSADDAYWSASDTDPLTSRRSR